MEKVIFGANMENILSWTTIYMEIIHAYQMEYKLYKQLTLLFVLIQVYAKQIEEGKMSEHDLKSKLLSMRTITADDFVSIVNKNN